MTGKFQVKRTPDGRFQFVLVSATGQVIATGAAYKTKTATLNAIKSTRVNAPDAEVEDQTTKERPAREASKAPVAKTAPAASMALGEVEEAPAPPAPPAPDVPSGERTLKKTKKKKKKKT